MCQLRIHSTQKTDTKLQHLPLKISKEFRAYGSTEWKRIKVAFEQNEMMMMIVIIITEKKMCVMNLCTANNIRNQNVLTVSQCVHCSLFTVQSSNSTDVLQFGSHIVEQYAFIDLNIQ